MTTALRQKVEPLHDGGLGGVGGRNQQTVGGPIALHAASLLLLLGTKPLVLSPASDREVA